MSSDHCRCYSLFKAPASSALFTVCSLISTSYSGLQRKIISFVFEIFEVRFDFQIV